MSVSTRGKMISSKQILAMMILFNAVCVAQVRPYIGGAIGLSDSGYTSPYFEGNTGVDVDLRRFFAEAEAALTPPTSRTPATVTP
jgi:hypothetical protein